MAILVITTGGTIGAMLVTDIEHQPRVKTMPPAGRDLVRETLAEKFAHVEARCVSLEERDSNFIDEPYRRNMVEIAAKVPERKILITHGTDTLLESADYIYRQTLTGAGLKGKTLILTGAMVPLANGEKSDGHRNLAFSLEQLARDDADLAPVSVVLCDHEFPDKKKGDWGPRLYPFGPGKYKNDHADDSRFSRIVLVS